MGNRIQERAVFKALLEASPSFLGEEIADWSQPSDENDFPDVIGKLQSGLRFGVELGEWLNEGETAAAISLERAQSAMLAAVGAQRPNATKHVGQVWLGRKPEAKVRPQDANCFSEQLYACIQGCDIDDALWDTPAAHMVRSAELVAYPMLGKYLQGLTLHPRRTGWDWPEHVAWIGFPSRGGAYSADTMLFSLLELSEKKRGHYSRGRMGFDHLSLVLVYDRALLYNSPVETSESTFDDATRIAGDVIGEEAGPFDSVLVFDATSGRIFKIHPRTA